MYTFQAAAELEDDDDLYRVMTPYISHAVYVPFHDACCMVRYNRTDEVMEDILSSNEALFQDVKYIYICISPSNVTRVYVPDFSKETRHEVVNARYVMHPSETPRIERMLRGDPLENSL